jgi:penicillin-binding protein 1A
MAEERPPETPNRQSPFTQELPVDVPMKRELTSERWGTFVVVGGMGLLLVVLFLLSVNLGFVVSNSLRRLPKVNQLAMWHPSESTRIYDRNNNLVATVSGDEDRTVRTLDRISPYLPRAIMAIEDNRFYHHTGVDVRGTLRAMATNLKGGDIQGGSTLTQQLIKNLYLSSERSLGRKLAEAILATRIERLYSKDKILELYLNMVYWGNQAYGAEKAAQRYFNVSSEELSLGQAALLAGLLKAPEGLNPFVYPNAAKKRQTLVLEAMQRFGFITNEQRLNALDEPLTYERSRSSYRYPFFVDFIQQEMIRQFGEDVVRRGGLIINTTLDQKTQEAAEKAMVTAFKSVTPSTNVEQGGMVVLGVDGSEVLAMVGGKDFNLSQFNNVTMARRSPGSTFKPFVYLTGFRLGKITPDSIIVDKPISYNTGFGYWRPKNYDGVFKGAMKIRYALAESRNTTTVQVGSWVGIDEIIKTARLAGVESPIAPNFASLLGASGISMLELANAYSTFARGGTYTPPHSILSIQDPQGKEIYRMVPEYERRLKKEHVGMINSALYTVVKKGTGKKAQIAQRDVAGKTGTTDQTRDIWFSGYTRDFVATVWFGHSQNRPLRGIGSGFCVTTWKDFADGYYNTHPSPPRELTMNPRPDF